MKTVTIEAINQAVKGTLTGNPAIAVTGVEQITDAAPGQLTFIGDKKHANLWGQSRASAAIVTDGLALEPGEGRALVRVPDADLALVVVLEMFAPPPPHCAPGIHPAAVVDPTAEIGENAAVGAGCYIGARVVIGPGSRLYPNVTVLDDSVIGAHTVIWSGTVIRERCRIGSHCILHPNVTIGADGFGYRPAPDGRGLVKVPQIGTVEIGDAVEIGANTCVDRGKFSATVIGDGTKLDNLVQIAHNCKLGRSCALSGLSGLAGSVTLGDGVIMGGGVGVKDHVTIGAGAQLGGRTGVMADVAPGATLLGTPADDVRRTLQQWAAVRQLPDLIKELRKK